MCAKYCKHCEPYSKWSSRDMGDGHTQTSDHFAKQSVLLSSPVINVLIATMCSLMVIFIN